VEEVPVDAVETPQAAATTEQQQLLMLRVQMTKFRFVLTPCRSARGRKQRQQGVLQKRRA
jgi:hypothetical protein